MLIMAAAVAGFIWGLAYRFFPEKFGAILISHFVNIAANPPPGATSTVSVSPA